MTLKGTGPFVLADDEKDMWDAPLESDDLQTAMLGRAPDGKGQHTPGAKLDAGKVRPALVLGGFARALWAVCEVGTHEAVKYTDNGWTEVEDEEDRYADAGLRHFLKASMGEEVDPDFECLHLAHEAWNALAKLDIHLRKNEPDKS